MSATYRFVFFRSFNTFFFKDGFVRSFFLLDFIYFVYQNDNKEREREKRKRILQQQQQLLLRVFSSSFCWGLKNYD